MVIIGNNALQKLEGAVRQLAEAQTLDEVASIRDISVAAQAYAKARGLGVEAINHATIIRFLADEKGGQLLARMEKQKGGQPPKRTGVETTPVLFPTLSDLGIDKNTAKEFRAAHEASKAGLLKPYLAEAQKESSRLSVSGLLQIATASRDPEAVKELKEAARLGDMGRKTVKGIRDRATKRQKAKTLPAAQRWKGEDGVYIGDALSVEWLEALPEGGFDLVLTDPPWAEDAIKCYTAVGQAALRALRPGGVCAVYLGKIYLPEIMRAVNEYLDYEWTFAFYYPESQVRIRKAAVYDCWRPVGIFRKPGPFTLPSYGRDLMPAPREKGEHEWQQALGPARELVKRYTGKGGAVLDPFVGGGTFTLAAKLEGCHFLGFDKDPDTVKIASGRLANG